MRADGLTYRDNVLLVGAGSAAFLNAERSFGSRFRKCACLEEAGPIVLEENFATIYVLMSSVRGAGEEDLLSLRLGGAMAKIVLLAQMYEEPEAIRMVRTISNPKGIADDYLICPVNGNLVQVEPQAVGVVEKKETQRADASGEIEELKARICQLELLAMQDDLTGLKNRRYIREFLHQVIERAKLEDISVSLVMFDIDNFKQYNDRFGHAVGDNVLKQAAVMMKRCCRGHDVIGRIGGDEFAVIFWEKFSTNVKESHNESRTPDRRQKKVSGPPDEAVAICERFRRAITLSRLSSLGVSGQGELTVSGGLASYPRDGDSVEKLLEEADKAMLEAKAGGKNRIYLVGKQR
ncbi:MAG: GGDEF domain-containing protein [Planctomycetes bacterium]|nr:GGDEF domain-containing protein [Planctomycetota bacterium]